MKMDDGFSTKLDASSLLPGPVPWVVLFLASLLLLPTGELAACTIFLT